MIVSSDGVHVWLFDISLPSILRDFKYFYIYPSFYQIIIQNIYEYKFVIELYIL